MPPALARKVVTCNELHGTSPKVPKKDKIQVPFHPRQNQFKPKVNMVSSSVPVPDNTPIQNPDTICVTATGSPIPEVEMPPNDDVLDDNEDLPAPYPPTH